MPRIADDRSEILNLLWRYANSIDRYANADGDVQAWLDTLTPETVVQYPGAVFTGTEELTALAGKTKSYGGLRHIIVNPEIEVDGDSAEVRAVLHLYRELTLHSVKGYDMTLRRTSEGWRITSVDLIPQFGA